MKLFVSPAVMIQNDNDCDVLHVSTCRPPYEMTEEIASLLNYVQAAGRDREDVIRFLATHREERDAEAVLNEIVEHGVLVEVVAPASGYHLATRDHPFLDMAEPGARALDNELMGAYLTHGAYPDVYLTLEYAEVIELEDAVDLEMPQMYSGLIFQLSLLLSGTFGRRRHVGGYFDHFTNYVQVEMLFKSVPSGGSRHPTEIFVDVRRSSLLEAGLYHFDVKRGCLGRLVRGSALDEWCEAAAADAPRAALREASEDFVLHFASAVDRAMFRYRDPRSFRAILVDAGHADAQLGALASYCNWSYQSRLRIDLSGLSVGLALPDGS